MTQFFRKVFDEHLTLPNEFITSYSKILANTPANLSMEDEYRFLTLDIKNLYVSITIEQILHITESFLKFSNTENILKQQVLQSLRTILHQHYFQFNDGLYKPVTDVATRLTSEIFLQCCENLNIKSIIEDKNIIFYTRYVDGILIMRNHI